MTHKIFVSHRHADRPIADVIVSALKNWAFNQDDIFYASEQSGAGNILIGDFVRRDICEAASECKLMILVFTAPDDDWSWCMYECGSNIRLQAE